MLSLILLIAVVVGAIIVANKEQLKRVGERDSVFAGVCGGIARRYNLPPMAVRIGYFGLCVISGGIGLAVYIALALSMPRE